MNQYLNTPLLLGTLLILSNHAFASNSGIRCFVDNKGVTNCTNIDAGKSTKAKPQPVASVPNPAAKLVGALPPAAITPVQAQAVPAPAPSKAPIRSTSVYRYKQENGAALFTNVRNNELTLVSVAVYQSFEKGWTGATFKTPNWRLNRDAYNDTILAMATAKSVDPALVRAVIHAESSFNPTAVSSAGAMGLMQLMPGTAKRFGVSNAFDPHENIRGGVTYLRFLLDKFNGDISLAAAGYNAGEGAVMKHGGIPPFSETRQYVVRVLDLHGKYRGEH